MEINIFFHTLDSGMACIKGLTRVNGAKSANNPQPELWFAGFGVFKPYHKRGFWLLIWQPTGQ